jgi:hypothetical protein
MLDFAQQHETFGYLASLCMVPVADIELRSKVIKQLTLLVMHRANPQLVPETCPVLAVV